MKGTCSAIIVVAMSMLRQAQISVSHPVFRGSHLEVVCGCHGHAVGA